MNNKINEIINDKDLTTAQKNKQLEKLGVSFRLADGKNKITEAEKKATVVDIKKGIYKGFGLLNHGIGGYDKVEVINNKLKYNIGDIKAYLYMGNHEFEILNGEDLKLMK